MKIAIVGLSESHDNAPWKDPEWEIWGLPWDTSAMWCQLLFEMHSNEFLEKAKRCGPKYRDRLIDLDTPVYMQERHPDIPLSLEYPLEKTNAMVGDYYGSSPAYMLARAILNNPDEIGLWGVDLSESIYDHQRPNLEYLIGFARGRGITVTVSPPLLTYKDTQHDHPALGNYTPHYPVRYGYEE